MAEENPQFKDPAFLKQMEQMSKPPDFPKNLEGKFPENVQPPPDRE